MARRGGNSMRGSGKSRRPQAQRGSGGVQPAYPGARIKNGLVQRARLLPMVEPTGVCPTGKIRYYPSSDAEEALRRTQHNRKIMRSAHVEQRWYPQEGDKPCICGGFHLTSKERA